MALVGAILLPTVRYLILPSLDSENHQRWIAASVMRGFGWVLIFAGTILAGYQALTFQVDVLTDGEPVRLFIGLTLALPAIFTGLVVGSVLSLLSSNRQTRL